MWTIAQSPLLWGVVRRLLVMHPGVHVGGYILASVRREKRTEKALIDGFQLNRRYGMTTR